MKIEDMPAGRQLDDLVTERVFGWPILEYDYSHDHNFEDSKKAFGDKPHVMHFPKEDNAYVYGFFPIGKLWSPSTDIASAWVVVEDTKNKGYSWWMTTTNASEYAKNAAHIRRYFDRETIVDAVGATMPLAICRATLKLMREVPL